MENLSKCVSWVSTMVSNQLQMVVCRRLGRGTKPNKRPPDLIPTFKTILYGINVDRFLFRVFELSCFRDE